MSFTLPVLPALETKFVVSGVKKSTSTGVSMGSPLIVCRPFRQGTFNIKNEDKTKETGLTIDTYSNHHEKYSNFVSKNPSSTSDVASQSVKVLVVHDK